MVPTCTALASSPALAELMLLTTVARLPSPVEMFDAVTLPVRRPPENAAVIVPTFNDPNDRIALGILGELFKDRVVTGIHAVDLVLGFGTLHCLSQQQPAV